MKHKAHMYFWITALIIAIMGLVQRLYSDSTVDINVGDTYYVIPSIYFTLLFAFIYFMLGVCYWFFYKINITLNKKLTKLHVVLTVLGLPAYLLLNRYIEFRSENPLFTVLGSYSMFQKILIGLFLSILIIQLVFPLNIIISLIKRKKA